MQPRLIPITLTEAHIRALCIYLDLHILSSEKRPFDPVRTSLWIMMAKSILIIQLLSSHSSAPKVHHTKCPWRSDPSTGALESHGQLEVIKHKERQIQKRFKANSEKIYEFQLADSPYV